MKRGQGIVPCVQLVRRGVSAEKSCEGVRADSVEAYSLNGLAAKKAWESLEAIASKPVSDRLRLGLAVNLQSKNGFLYRLYPREHPIIYNLTTSQSYCLQVEDENLPLADKLLILMEWVRTSPDHVEMLANKTRISDMEKELRVLEGEGWPGGGVGETLGGTLRTLNGLTLNGTLTYGTTTAATTSAFYLSEDYFSEETWVPWPLMDRLGALVLPVWYRELGRPAVRGTVADADNRRLVVESALNVMALLADARRIMREEYERDGSGDGRECAENAKEGCEEANL